VEPPSHKVERGSRLILSLTALALHKTSVSWNKTDVSPLNESQRIVWECPLCGAPVDDNDLWVNAQRGERARGRREVVVWGDEPVRFHLGHFRERLDENFYRLTP
jgi:hypothetical protein